MTDLPIVQIAAVSLESLCAVVAVEVVKLFGIGREGLSSRYELSQVESEVVANEVIRPTEVPQSSIHNQTRNRGVDENSDCEFELLSEIGGGIKVLADVSAKRETKKVLSPMLLMTDRGIFSIDWFVVNLVGVSPAGMQYNTNESILTNSGEN